MLTYHERQDFFTFPAGSRAHGCNTRGVAGGLAGDVFAKMPEMDFAYKAACKEGVEAGGFLPFQADDGTWWYNLFTQVEPGADAKVDYIVDSLKGAIEHASSKGVATMTIPCIGAGIGGLNWGLVRAAFYEEFVDGPFHLQVVTRGRFSDYPN